MPKVHSENYMALGESKPATSTTSRGSWWLNTDTFYAEARKRFPEAGTPVVDRGKVHLYASDAPTLGARMARMRAS